MGIGREIFAIAGRTGRAGYWLTTLALLAAVVVVGILVAAIAGVAPDGPVATVLAVVSLPFFVAWIWIGVAVSVRRLHDRDRSGWWILVFWFAPALLQGIGAVDRTGILALVCGIAATGVSLWYFVELGFLPGTPGPNRFGPDPRAADAAAEAGVAPSIPSSTPPAPPVVVRRDPWAR